MRHRLVAVVSSLSSLLLLAGGLALLGLATAAPASAATRVIPVPTASAGLGRIVGSPDGNVWFVESDANKVGRISPNGQLVEFPLPASGSASKAEDLDVAPDGTVWVLFDSGEWIRHLRPDGSVIRDLEIGEGYPYGREVRVAPDGNAWVTMSFDTSFVTVVNDAGYRDLTQPCEDALGRAADGTMWCRTDSGIGRADATSSYPANNYAAYPYALAGGPVGSIWFGRYFGGTWLSAPDDGEVGYLNAATGQVTAFNTGSRTAPNSLVQGPDGNMWFTSIGDAKGIGHIRPDGKGGVLTQIGGYAPNSLTFGRDGAVYATDATNNVIIRTTTDELQVTNVDPGEGSVLTGGGGGAAATVGKVKVGKGAVPVKNGAVGLRLKCAKDAPQACAGKARLVTNAKKKPKAISKAVKYEVKPGKGEQLSLKLTAKAFAVLKKGKATKVRLELYAKGGKQPVAVQTLKVRR